MFQLNIQVEKKDLIYFNLSIETNKLLIFLVEVTEGERLEPLKKLIEELPQTNRSVLAATTIFLSKLTKKSQVNKMTLEKLGSIFGSSLLRSGNEIASS